MSCRDASGSRPATLRVGEGGRDGAQAGLSWSTVLAKREGYRKAFASFDPERVSRCTDEDVRRLLQNDGIIQHRGKIEGVIGNARALSRALGARGSTFVGPTICYAFIQVAGLVNGHTLRSD